MEIKCKDQYEQKRESVEQLADNQVTKSPTVRPQQHTSSQRGPNEAASIQALHQFVFHEISKYVNVQQSGVKQHPFTFQRTGDEFCLTALHHLSVKEYANIRQHLITIFSGIPRGTTTGHMPSPPPWDAS